MPKQTSESQIFDDIKNFDAQVVSTYLKRNATIKHMDEMYLLDWDETPQNQKLKLTKAPDGRNTILGVVRLMTATEPTFSVPSATNDDEANAYNEKMELAAGAMWAASNQAQQMTVERDVCQSLALYDETYLTITNTRDLSSALKQHAETGKLSWLNDRVHELADEVPYLFTPVPPGDAYPLMGRTGMIVYVQEQTITVAEALERFGGMAIEAIGSRKQADAVVVTEHWDNKYHVVRIGGKKVLMVEHGLGFIPVTMRIANGTRLYKEPERQRQPLLYGMYESGLWRDKNAVLTATMNRLRALGLNAQFVHRRGSADATLELDFSQMGGVINLAPGSDLKLLSEALIDGNTMGALNLLDGMITDSTIYKQALGAPVSGPTAYATISLLSQAGRLPLVPIQEAAQEVLAGAMRVAMKWIKLDDEARNIYKARDLVKLDPKQLPERVVFEVSMDVDLPQDALRNANIAVMLKDKGLADDRWIHENIMKIGQTVDMKKRIVAQQISELLIQNTVQKFMEQWQKQTAPQPPQQPNPQSQPQPGQGQGFDPNAGGQSPVEMMGTPGEQPVQPGQQMTPEMMAGGG